SYAEEAERLSHEAYEASLGELGSERKVLLGMPNNEEERLRQRLYNSTIRNREMENVLKMAQKSQASAPAPSRPQGRPPVGRTASPVEWYTSERRNEKIFLVWQSHEHVCEVCV